eukprot:520923_1
MSLFRSFMATIIVILLVRSDNITISTQLGYITGNVSHEWSVPIYSFYGIRYAPPPLGDLRFRPSKVQTTPWNDIYDATQYKPQCIQPKSLIPSRDLPMSEDCLYLNIWTSNINNKNKTLLPVMLYIHGGAFLEGSADDAVFDATNILGQRNGQFVYVSIEYRLGPIGFLSNQEIYNEGKNENWSSYGGLNGINDQINAGYPINNLTYLRSIPAEQFTEAFIGNTTVMILIPAVDGLVLNDMPSNIYANGIGNGINGKLNAEEAVVMGFNSMDGINPFPSVGGPTPTNEQEFNAFVSYYIANESQANAIKNVYYNPENFKPIAPNHNSYELAWYTLNGDVCVSCPSFLMASEISETNVTGNMYVYEFLGSGQPHGMYYAAHGSELSYVFDNPNVDSNIVFEMPWSQNLSDSMVNSWTNYGLYGIPDIETASVKIKWETFDTETQQVMLFDNNIKLEKNYKNHYRDNVCDFWYLQVGYDTMFNICNFIGSPV